MNFCREESHIQKTSKHFIMGCKSQLLISEEESLTESVLKYRCLYDKSYADYKSKVFVEIA